MQQSSASQTDLGPEYRNRIITYAAINLCLNPKVEDFVIYTKRKIAGIFDDVIIKVCFKEELHLKPHIYLIKTKHDSKDKLLHIVKNVKKFLQSYSQVLQGRNNSEIFKDVPDSVIKFGFFCNKKIEVQSLKKEFLCDIIKRNNNDVSVFPFGNLNINASQLQSQNSMQHNAFFDNFYLYTEQPSYGDIIQEVNKLCKTIGSVNMTNYIGDYFKIPELSKNGLSKKIFETELLKIRLQNYIVTPTEFVSIRQEQAKVWNKITLDHDVTLIDDILDIERSLFGCFVHKVNQLLENTIEWNHAIKNYGKLDQVSIEKFKEISQNLGPRQWTSAPGTIKSLVETLWMYDQLPLILKANQAPSILKEFQHLNKRFIIIGGFKNSDYSVTNALPPKIFANVQDIVLDSLRKELLQVILVSLQGRKPVKLYDIVENDQNCLTKLTSSIVLKLIRKCNAYLQEECLQSLESMVFVIEDKKSEIATTIDEIEPNENNTYEIICRPYEVQNIFKLINENFKYKYHSVIHLRKAIDSKLEFLNGDKFKLRNFFINEYRDNIYYLDVDEPIPLIGQRLGNREYSYMPRYFRKAIIQHSTFKVQERRICFMSGDVDSLDSDIKKQIIQEPLGDNLEKKLEKNQNVLIDVKEHLVEEYWDSLSTKQCPLFHVKVVHGVMVLLKYRNCSNMNAYLSYSEQAFEESTFFSEITSKITVISGESGIGKTSLVRSLSAMQDEKNYTLICNLAEYRDVLKMDNKMLYDPPLDVIFDKFESFPFKEFMKAIQEYHKEKRRLTLFVDAFDEVLPAHKRAVLYFMENIAKCDVQIIVASRLFFDTLLINNFEVQPLKIDNLRREDSEGYFKSQGLADVKINDIPDELLINPLFLTFLCYLFREGSLDYSKFNRFDIFKNVLSKKIERYYRKSNRVFSTSLEAYRSNILDIHKVLAVVVVFGKELTIEQEIIEDYDESLRLFKDLNIKLGIVKYFNGDYAVFLHQSFAEFLACEWLSEKLLEEDFDEPVQVIYRWMVRECDRNVRYFFDNMICEGNKFHRAVLREDLEIIRNLAYEDPDAVRELDKCGRYALLLAASYCYDQNYEILEEVVLQSYLTFLEDFDRPDLFMKWNWTQFLNVLSKECFFDKACGQNLAVTVFGYLSTFQGRINTSKNILDACDNSNVDIAHALVVESNPPMMEYYDVVMDMAMKRRRTNIIHDLIEMKHQFNLSFIFNEAADPSQLAEAIFDETNGEFTALHLACMFGDEKIVTDLLENETEDDPTWSSVYSTDEYGNIPICYAIMQGNHDIISSVISKMKDLSFKDKDGNTLLHLSCRFLNEFSLNALLLTGAFYVSERNGRGKTALHIVAGLDWAELKEIGIAIVAKENDEEANDPILEYVVDMANHSGSYHISESPEIEDACRVAVSAVLDILLDHDADILEQDDEGDTALHIAYMQSNRLVFEYLMDKSKGAAFIRNKNGLSVFDFARRDGKLKMLDSLLNKSISIDAAPTNIVEDDTMSVEEDSDLENHTDIIDDNIITGLSLLTIEEDSSIKNDLKFVEGRGWTLLHKATGEGRSDIIEVLLDKGFPTDVPDDDGCIPLHFATSENDVLLLLKKCPNLQDVNRKSRNDETPLHTASRSGRLDVVKTLLSVNADCTIKNIFGQTPLHTATLANNVEMVKILVNHGANVDEPNKGGATSLHLATAECNALLVGYLLHMGADSTLRDYLGNTSLHLACQYGFVQIVQILVNRSPEVTTFCNKQGYRPYDLACIEDKRDVIEYLIRNCAAMNSRISGDVLHRIVENGHLAILEMLFESSIITKDDAECKGRQGNTVLHVATLRDHINIVKFLLDRGVKVDSVNDDLYTPMHLAQSVECAELLASRYVHHSEVHARSIYGETPLHKACERINYKLVNFVLSIQADATCKDIIGWTPLHIAVTTSTVLEVHALLDHGANINEKNKYTATPLHIAATNSSMTVKALVERGADVTVINEYGDFAVDRRKQLSYESQTKKKDIKTTSYNVLDMACSKGEYGVIKYLLKECPAVKQLKLAVQTLFNVVARGDLLCLKMLLEERFIVEDDLKYSKNDGNNLIHTAANYGHIQIVRFLEKKGLQLNKLNNTQITSLNVAIYKGYKHISQHLLQSTDTSEDRDKWSALEVAVIGSDVNLVEMLLENDVDVNTRMKNDGSALHRVVVNGSLPIVRVLIKYKIDIEITDENGYTAFELGCIMNRHNIIKCLLNGYPMLRQRKLSNKTTFAIVKSGSLKSLELLVEENIVTIEDLHMVDECQRTLLHTAAFYEHTDVMRFLLQKGVKANPLDCEKYTPLHLARSAEDAKLLIDHYENLDDMNARTIRGSTPLHTASGSGFDGVVRVLLDAKAAVSAIMEDGRTPLHCAAEKNENVSIVEMLLEHKSPVNQPDKASKTPLHIATLLDALSVVQVLVNHDADVELKDEEDNIALHLACKMGHLRTVEYLTSIHVDTISLRNKYEFTPFDYACLFEKSDVIEYFLVRYSDTIRQQFSDMALYSIIDQGKLASLKLILDYNIITKEDLERPLSYGYTALHLATFNSCTEIMRFLLENGMSVNPADEGGMRPIHYVNTAEDAKLLLGYYKNPTDLYERSDNGRTPLHTASKRGCADIVRLFLSRQAVVSARDKSEWTPLLLAAYADEVECVRILLQNGADVSEANCQSETALHLAVQNASWALIDVLLDNGADVKLKDSCGDTVLHSVLKCYRWNTWFVESSIHDNEVARDNVQELIGTLLERGADPFEVNNDGESAIVLVKELKLNDLSRKMSYKRRRLNDEDTTK